jgi:hypothetical protein
LKLVWNFECYLYQPTLHNGRFVAYTEHTGQKRLVRPVEEPSNNADNEDNFDRSENITELVSSDSVVAVKAEDDNIE